MGPSSLSVNFLADWRQILTEALQRDGYLVEPGDDAHQVAIKFFNVQRALVPLAQRRIVEADTLSCPPRVAAGYAKLRSKFENGADVAPHQSRSWHLRATFFDGLLHDWGIQHFHLGEQFEATGSGLVDRTGPILYAMVTTDTVYCIRIDDHGKWTELELLRTVYRNWPELLLRFRPQGIVGISGPTITESELKLRRKNGIVGLIEIEPGIFLFSPGGGYASSGASIPVVKTAMLYRKTIQALEDQVRSNEQFIRQNLVEAGVVIETPLPLLLRLRDGEFVAVHERSKRIYGLGVTLGF